jgi:hypothetical protein
VKCLLNGPFHSIRARGTLNSLTAAAALLEAACHSKCPNRIAASAADAKVWYLHAQFRQGAWSRNVEMPNERLYQIARIILACLFILSLRPVWSGYGGSKCECFNVVALLRYVGCATK